MARRLERAGSSAWLLLILVGCGPSSTELTLVDRIAGDWAWLESTGGIAGLTRTPASEGFDMSLRFTPPDQVELFRDGTSQVRTGVAYFVGPDGNSDNLSYEQPLFGFESAIVELLADTLFLIDPCCDGFVRRWVRAP